MYDNYYSQQSRIKLYVRRVLISESFQDLLPRWLSFLFGLVDADDLPLNVSREVLQQASTLKIIRKKIVRKAIEMLKKLSDAAEADPTEEETSSGWFGIGGKSKEREEAIKKQEEARQKYQRFWKSFGKSVKMGVIEDSTNKARILPLLRFHTTASDGNLTTLDAYVSRMKEHQTSIYYLVGTGSLEEIQKSPFVEAVMQRGFEVILFNDPLDEYMMGHVRSYDGEIQ